MPDKILPEAFTRQDRDNIITLGVRQLDMMDEVREIKDSIKDIQNNTISKLERLTLEKAAQKDVDFQNTRIDTLENHWSWAVGVGAGVLILMGVVTSLITYIYFTDLNTIKTELQNHINETK